MHSANNSPPDIIVYGGCFDPPHQGHIDFVHALKALHPSSQILILPSYSPVTAGGGTKNASVAFEHRVKMCRIAFEPTAAVSILESTLPTPNFTFKTLRVLRETKTDSKISLAIGQDQMNSFDRWQNPQEILKHHDLYVAKRVSSVGETRPLHREVADVVKKLDGDYKWMEQTSKFFSSDYNHSIFLLKTQLSDAESTVIRYHLENSPDRLPSQWLPEELLSYINTHSLYSNYKKAKNGTS